MKKLLVCLAVSSVLFTGCSFHKSTEGIIKVNDQVITLAEFDDAFNKSMDKSFLKSLGGSKKLAEEGNNPIFGIFKEKVTNELIVKALIDQEIAKRNITATKEDLDKELKAVIDKVGSKEELNTMLKQRGISNNDFMKDLETQVKIKKLVNSMQKVSISDADAKKYYDTHKQEFTHGEQVRASHILISANTLQLIQEIKEKNKDIDAAALNAELEKRMAAQKAKAEEILAEVKKNPDDFAKIAEKKSDDKASAVRGGELGFFPKEAMVKEFAEAAFSMKPDTISETVITTPYGYHIIKVTDRMAAGSTPFDKVKEELKYYLETQKQIEVLKNFTASAMKTAKIEYLDENFDPAKVKTPVSPIPQEKKNNK